MKIVQQLTAQINELRKQIEMIQAKCPHTEYMITFYSWRPGDISPAHVCLECHACLGPASENEARVLWEKHFNR